MNACRDFGDDIYEILSGNISRNKKQSYLNHSSHCPQCREELKVARKIWNALDGYQEIEAPQALREQTLAVVYAEAKREQVQATLVAGSFGRLSLNRVLVAIFAGVALSLLFILMLGQKVDIQPLTPEQLLGLGTLWSGLLITGFCWLLGKFNIGNLKLNSVALFALLTTFLVMVGTYLCPDATAYGWWISTSIGSQAQTQLGNVGGCFVFGVFYVLPAAFLISPTIRKTFKSALWRHSLITAILCVALLLPAIYIQCAYLAKGFMFSWIGGAFVGAFGGIYGGVSLAVFRPKMLSGQSV